MNEVSATSTTGFNRRSVLSLGSVLVAAMIVPTVVKAAPASTAAKVGGATVKAVQFKNNAITLAGNLYLPAGFTEGRKYAAIITVHPGGGVKEQTAGLYALKLAEQGFVTLAFDAGHQGASGGEPRFLDDPMRRVGDIYSAVDYLISLPYIDANRIGALGVCAGSGTAIKAASTDRRIKVVGTVSAVDVGAATRKGWDGKATVAEQIATLDAVAKQRSAEVTGAAPVYVPYVPAVGDKTAPRDLQEAADYYLTPRGQHPNAPNKLLLTSLSAMVSFTGFDQIETLLTQPLMVVAGSEAGSLWHSHELHAKAAGPKELFVVPGATHMDLYDGAGADLAAGKLAPFFTRTLA
ncbi:alpha/beta hydrolase [Bosea sp. 2KB_26]|uniref:alpha/beta hydrolase n=1 Tax=Bosea sp. 2KB_26 TaxID=3237475 RepID=UPI000DE374BA